MAIRLERGRNVNIMHFVVNGFRQWVDIRNLTFLAKSTLVGNIAAGISQNYIDKFSSMPNRGTLSYVSLSHFNILDHEIVSVHLCSN